MNETQMNHVMLDIETLSTDSNALVVSISAVQFDMTTGEIGEKFEIGLDQDQQTAKGAVIDEETVKWWSEQSQEARDMLNRLEKIDVDMALDSFALWVKTNFKAPSKIKLWGNGATFDNVIVENLFKRHDVKFPIPYYCHKDVRTLTYLTKTQPRKYEFTGVKHNGIDDCLHQIKYCVDGYRKFHSLDKVPTFAPLVDETLEEPRSYLVLCVNRSPWDEDEENMVEVISNSESHKMLVLLEKHFGIKNHHKTVESEDK